jgi:uncharacterized SAM-binding protein YcdF (DUF218 family)
VPLSSSVPATRSAWRYLGDRDVQYAALGTLLAVLLSAGMVWLGYLIHVCRVAVRSPLVVPRRMVVLVFGYQLHDGLPQCDYRWRLRRLLKMARAQKVERVLLLGGCNSGTRSEAAAGYEWLQRHGLSADVRVELEQESIDSLENLRQARMLLRTQVPDAQLPPVALVSSRYHLARCQLLARYLGFSCVTIAAEPVLPRRARYVAALLLEATYLMWIDVGMRWAQLTGRQRLRSRLR